MEPFYKFRKVVVLQHHPDPGYSGTSTNRSPAAALPHPEELYQRQPLVKTAASFVKQQHYQQTEGPPPHSPPILKRGFVELRWPVPSITNELNCEPQHRVSTTEQSRIQGRDQATCIQTNSVHSSVAVPLLSQAASVQAISQSSQVFNLIQPTEDGRYTHSHTDSDT